MVIDTLPIFTRDSEQSEKVIWKWEEAFWIQQF